MKKAHCDFLKRIVSLSAARKGRDSLYELIGPIRHPKAPFYALVRDMVCDPRFHSVIENTDLWKEYALLSIYLFLETLDGNAWKHTSTLYDKSEQYLNRWFADHILPLSEYEIILRLKALSGQEGDGTKESGRFACERPVEDVCDCTSDGVGTADVLNDTRGAGRAPGGSDKTERPVPLDCYDSELMRLALMVGRGGSEDVCLPGRFLRASKSDIMGITVGKDIASALPSELAMLSCPATESVFLDRLVRNRLQVFASASQVKGRRTKKDGPVFLCMDTSGSMEGKPEQMAKSLALAIAEIAQRRRRPVCLVNYSHTVSFFMLTDIRIQRGSLMRFMSKSYGGGNNEDLLFRFIFEILPKMKAYRRFAHAFEGADLLMVSDFIWMKLQPEIRRHLLSARLKGMKYYALGIGTKDVFECVAKGKSQEEYDEANGGYSFFRDCDHTFAFDVLTRRCHKITSKTVIKK